MSRHFRALHGGGELVEEAILQCVKEESKAMIAMDSTKRYGVRIITTEKSTQITMRDAFTDETSEREYPVVLSKEARKDIAEKALKQVLDGVPIIWRQLVEPHITYTDSQTGELKTYWDEEWDELHLTSEERRPKVKF